jgi:hypothetical protein
VPLPVAESCLGADMTDLRPTGRVLGIINNTQFFENGKFKGEGGKMGRKIHKGNFHNGKLNQIYVKGEGGKMGRKIHKGNFHNGRLIKYII